MFKFAFRSYHLGKPIHTGRNERGWHVYNDPVSASDESNTTYIKLIVCIVLRASLRLGFSLHTLENLLNHISRAAACDFLVFAPVLQDMKNTDAYKLIETNYAFHGLIMWHSHPGGPMLRSEKVGWLTTSVSCRKSYWKQSALRVEPCILDTRQCDCLCWLQEIPAWVFTSCYMMVYSGLMLQERSFWF